MGIRKVYSVIIPAYNAASYIEECISSVLNQTLDDYEIIIVNDASTDGTSSLIAHMAKQNSKIKIVNQEENMGELLTRKTGINHAQGEYCLFLDADDTLISTALEYIDNILVKKRYDIIAFGVKVLSENDVDDEHLQAAHSYFTPYQGELNGKNIFVECFENHAYSHNVWDKVYRTILCKEAFAYITEKCIAIGVDIYTYFVFSYLAQTFLGIKDELYEYHVGRGITGKKSMSIGKFEMHCRQSHVISLCENFLKNQNKLSCYQAILQRLSNDGLMDCIGCFMRNISEEDASAAMKLLCQYWGNEAVDKEMKKLLQRQATETKQLRHCVEELSSYAEELKNTISEKYWKFPYDRVPKGSHVIIYGAGEAGKDYVRQIMQTQWGQIVLWVDQGKKGMMLYGITVSGIGEITKIKYDYLLIAIADKKTRQEIVKQLRGMNIPANTILS